MSGTSTHVLPRICAMSAGTVGGCMSDCRQGHRACRRCHALLSVTLCGCAACQIHTTVSTTCRALYQGHDCFTDLRITPDRR